MARYIDADKLKERLLAISVVADDWYGMGINRGLDRAETAIENEPTADVVPREDLTKAIENFIAAQDKVMSEAKAELAKEIFEEIEKALSDNFHADCQMGDCIEDYYDDNLRDDIAELRKKYIN